MAEQHETSHGLVIHAFSPTKVVQKTVFHKTKHRKTSDDVSPGKS
jgi:hypothetical protein